MFYQIKKMTQYVLNIVNTIYPSRDRIAGSLVERVTCIFILSCGGILIL